jgi:hypothetical protein
VAAAELVVGEEGPALEDGDWEEIRAACPVLLGHLVPEPGVLLPSTAA